MKTTAKLLSLTLLLAATMSVCGVSSAEEVKDSTSTQIVSVEDSDLRNEEALRVAVGDFDDEEFLLSADEVATIADNVYVSFNDISAQGYERSVTSMFSGEASERVETTQSTSSTFNGTLTLASATSETVTVRQSAVATTSLSFDDSTEQYAVDAGKSYYEQVSTSNSGSAITTYSATSLLGNFDSVGYTDGSYGISTLDSGIVYFSTYTWKGGTATTGDDGKTYYYWGTTKNWSSTWKDKNDALFNATGSAYNIVTVGSAGITATDLTVQGTTGYTFIYEEGAVLTVTGVVTIDGNSSLTITGGTNNFGDSTVSDYMYIGYTSSSSKSGTNGGSLIITGGTNTFTDNNIFVGNTYDSGSITIGSEDGEAEDLTVTFKANHMYIGHSSNSTGSLTINSGVNTFNCDVALGYDDKDSEGTLTITGGTNIFEETIEIGGSGTGTMTIIGGTTTIEGATTIASDSKLSVSGGTVYIETQIGTTATGDVTITGNAEIIISGDLLESIAELAESGEEGSIAVISANTITFGDVEIDAETEDLDATINAYVSAEGYDLTWSYSNSTLYVVAAVVATPEPELFSVFFGIGAIALTATRRRRRKVA